MRQQAIGFVRNSKANQQRMVRDWNASHPTGTPVTLIKDNGERVETKTTSEALMLSGHTAVIWMEGIRGCWSLDRVEPRG